MEILQWISFIIIIAFVVNFFLPTKGVSNITAKEAKDKFAEKGIQFIDVRTPGEYKANHQKKFTNVPLANLSKRIGELDKNEEVVVICQSGMRSAKAAKILKKQGFEKVSNVKGGMGTWGIR
ncbi:rhodanese-like domain-containing protein [Virgibacillus doumboii]|uniref:rhodanese-like domain-containing protein n=1 Tax=Virgibacillus doumboii TaxID=2697503 RepID=UPI0013DF6A87|nr:rhodanese-like domain-containing protein [Virgibacillus doumboii]